ncbi:hypothetical protein GOV03_00865 [Candidatus Woesearchaeota archaeon]|nr:hypothetical protein [Candidatus Woesearchaeota archaeon]
MAKCPKCGSKNVEIIDDEMGFIKCKACGFNELTGYENLGEERNTQREKTKYNPYKTGGSARGRKK